MGRQDSSGQKSPSHKDLVRSVSKQLKHYFELRRQEDGFDLSGPECPRPDYPALKSRPMLLYEGLHDRNVKHFYSDGVVKQRITHLRAHGAGEETKQVKKLMKRTMDRTSYLPPALLNYAAAMYDDQPPWAGSPTLGEEPKYSKNSEKYLTGSFGEWKIKQKANRRRGFGNPEPTLKRAFKESHDAKPRVLRSVPSGWIGSRECNRLINDASKILVSTKYQQPRSRPQSSRASSSQTSRSEYQRTRARSASPASSRPTTTKSQLTTIGSRSNTRSSFRSSVSAQSQHQQTTRSPVPKKKPTQRLTHRPQSSRNVVTSRPTSSVMSYHDAKDDVVRDYEEEKTAENLDKGKIYYDIDGRRKPVVHRLSNEEGYLERDDDAAVAAPLAEDDGSEDGKVPDWLRNQMRRQDVSEKKMPYNDSVKPVQVIEPETARSEDVTQRPGIRRRPKSAKRSKSSLTHSSRAEHDRASITLSEGSYEQVKLDDSESEEGDTFVEDKGCQTGWELFVHYDQTENVLHDASIDPTEYTVKVCTGSGNGASTKAKIYIALYGTRGRSPDIELKDCVNHKVPFQQGALDKFVVTSSYVGVLSKIMIGHDLTNIDGWFLDSVSIHDPVKNEVYEFVCNKWLSIRSEDKQTRRTLTVSASRVDHPDDKSDQTDDLSEQQTELEGDTELNPPRESNVVEAAPSDSVVSTTHLNNDTETGSERQPKKSLSLASESDRSQSSREPRQQKPYILTAEAPKHKGSIRSIDDFESDVARHSEKRSESDKLEERHLTDSECQTAVFEERSILSEAPDTDRSERDLASERLEAFKAGQKAERERQKIKEEENLAAKEADERSIIQGPTIHQAAKSGDISRVNVLLDHNKDLKNSVDSRGNTPLHLAADQGHADVVKLLVAVGADLDARDQAGYEPVHLATLNGHVSCAMPLVAMGASVNSQTDDMKTPLHLAALGGNLSTCKWLVANRSHLEVEDDFGRTPIDLAANNNHEEVVTFLRACINDSKIHGSQSSALSLLRNGTEGGESVTSWKDDQAEKPLIQHGGKDSDEGSVADLRKESREEEMAAKQKAYADMQQKLQESNMTYLDRIRYEVDNS